MTGIWTNTGEGWQLSYPQVFQEEATLHKLIEENPQLLPLACSPRLTILGSEIKLGTGYADILAVESNGRPAIIEVKLAGNPEARRAIVSQVIAYAAFLHGFTIESLEQGPYGNHLRMKATSLSWMRYKLRTKKGRWMSICSRPHCRSSWTKAISGWFSCWTKFHPNWQGLLLTWTP